MAEVPKVDKKIKPERFQQIMLINETIDAAVKQTMHMARLFSDNVKDPYVEMTYLNRLIKEIKTEMNKVSKRIT